MGALTDSRKRFPDQHRLPSQPLSDSPPAKKTKLSTPSTSRRMEPATADRSMRDEPDNRPQALRRFPPPSPLPRPIHGPQRNIRAFGLGSSNSRQSPHLEFLGFDPLVGRAGSVSSTERGETSAGRISYPSPGFGLEEYKQLVKDVQEVRSAPPRETPDDVSTLPPVSDLPVVERDTEETPSDLYILDRKVGEDGKMVAESTAVREDRPLVKRTPVYKELLQATRRFDSVLNDLEFQSKFEEKKRASWIFTREALAKKTEELKKSAVDLHGPFAPLMDEDEEAIKRALQRGRMRDILVTHESSNIEITREILQCLSHGAWLNDEVINVYLELLKEREIREPKTFLKCHFFNTFFYKKLVGGRNGYDFKAVRRWTSQRKLGYNLMDCDKIFVPIHKEVHWCLAVINVKDETFQYLDSLGGMDRTVIRTLARYFMDEAKDKSNKQIDTLSWKQEEINSLPLQANGWDCGMFMLKYTDFYSRGLGLNFGQEHMDYFRKRTIKEILLLRAE